MQGRTAEDRQRQSRIPGEISGQAASKHSPGEQAEVGAGGEQSEKARTVQGQVQRKKTWV